MTAEEHRESLKERLREAHKKYRSTPKWWDLVISANLMSNDKDSYRFTMNLSKEVLREVKLEKLIGIRQ